MEQVPWVAHRLSPGQGLSLMLSRHTALAETGKSNILLKYCYLFTFILVNPNYPITIVF